MAARRKPDPKPGDRAPRKPTPGDAEVPPERIQRRGLTAEQRTAYALAFQLRLEAERNRVEVERGELHMQRILLERDQKVLQLERERLIQELEKEKAQHKAAP